MRYRVYDTVKQCYVTDEPGWIIKPNGELALNEYGDETGMPNCISEFSLGITDQNGNEVFEGDILSGEENKGNLTINSNAGSFTYHEWKNDIVHIAKISPSDLQLTAYYCNIGCVVIGNIHNNHGLCMKG